MAFEYPVEARDAGSIEPDASHAFLLHVEDGIDAKLAFEIGEVRGQLQHVVVERGAGGRADEPVGPDHRNFRRGTHGHGAGRDRVVEDAVGIFLQDAVPDGGVPEVPAEVDAEYGLRGVDGHGHADSRVPRQAVHELAQSVAIGLKFFVGEAGVVELIQREVALEAASPAVDLLQVREHRIEDIALRYRRSRCGDLGTRCPGVDPFLDERNLGGRRPRGFLRRRHRAFVHPFEEARTVRVAGEDLFAGDEFRQVADVIHAAFDGPVLTVASVAVRLEDGLHLRGEFLLLVGAGRDAECEEAAESEGNGLRGHPATSEALRAHGHDNRRRTGSDCNGLTRV